MQNSIEKRVLGWHQVLGPGLLFAGAAVGVSHLIQSTRAGGIYGFSLIGFILFANLAKYPAFRFGNQYAAASGSNLIIAYQRRSAGAIGMFIISTLLTMFVGCAAVSLTTAGLFIETFGVEAETFNIVLGVWAIVIATLYFGQFKALDVVVKLLLAFLTITTVLATVLVVPSLSQASDLNFWPSQFDTATVIFIAALIGWMPAPLDTSVWQSLWSQAKARSECRSLSMKESALDFNIGFTGTTLLALCFLIMGAATLFNSGQEFETSAAGFAGQLVDIYRATLGDTIATLVGAAAMAVIFTTTLTAIDAWPRSMASAVTIVRNPSHPPELELSDNRDKSYWIWMLLLMAGAAVIINLLTNSFSLLIDIATTVSFVTAPIFAILNHQAMFGPSVPESSRPSHAMRIWSLLGIASLVIFTATYALLRLNS